MASRKKKTRPIKKGQRKPLSQRKLERLGRLVVEFVDEQCITCPETIYQTDRVIENAYDFVRRLAEVVGYHVEPQDEEVSESVAKLVEASDSDPHSHSGNCFKGARKCEDCGIGNLCDVCHTHDEPRGDCVCCPKCTECEKEDHETPD